MAYSHNLIKLKMFPTLKSHILFYRTGLVATVCGTVRQISHILKLIMADNWQFLICSSFVYSNGLAIWLGVPHIRTKKVNYG